MNKYLMEEKIQMINKRCKRCSSSITFRNKNQNHNEMPFYINQQNLKTGETMEEQQLFHCVRGQIP